MLGPDVALVPGLLDDNQLRGDVEDWLAERNRQSDKLQAETLWWAKAAAWIAGAFGVIGTVVAIGVAFLGK
jgi:hypothetical protein